MKSSQNVFPLCDYDLSATLASGQAFRWQRLNETWIGVIGQHWVRLHSKDNLLTAETAEPVSDWRWLTNFLQLDLDLNPVLASFPTDESMQLAVNSCRGLRLLRQDLWECLASFILSSTKQIVQIQQIIGLLSERFGAPLDVPEGYDPVFAFPTAERIAGLSEAELRHCKMGFRAPYLLAAAQAISMKEFDLEKVRKMTLQQARTALTSLPGVGPKIADCVLLFAYGFPQAFPVDVWVMKALRHLYFPKRKPSKQRLQRFTESYFGPNAGYAQQYLFHYMRTQQRKVAKK